VALKQPTRTRQINKGSKPLVLKIIGKEFPDLL